MLPNTDTVNSTVGSHQALTGQLAQEWQHSCPCLGTSTDSVWWGHEPLWEYPAVGCCFCLHILPHPTFLLSKLLCAPFPSLILAPRGPRNNASLWANTSYPQTSSNTRELGVGHPWLDEAPVDILKKKSKTRQHWVLKLVHLRDTVLSSRWQQKAKPWFYRKPWHIQDLGQHPLGLTSAVILPL